MRIGSDQAMESLPLSGDGQPSGKLHLHNVSKQCYQLGIHEPVGDISYSNHHTEGLKQGVHIGVAPGVSVAVWMHPMQHHVVKAWLPAAGL